ncbi:MAG: hypothetical protein HQL35_09990 [Alphaproteobacteria bacterium]|nr:hypothetical protein [Alphaproteobacteria bacterium]
MFSFKKIDPVKTVKGMTFDVNFKDWRKPTWRQRILASMSYMSVLCLVPAAIGKGDAFVQFHARQGLVLWLITILSLFSLFIPGLGKWTFSSLAWPIMGLQALGLMSVMLGKTWKFPVIHRIAGIL